MRCNAAPYEGKGSYIFVSYCHEDETRVYPCIEMMAREGCRVWYDEGITPGDEWQETIADHLAGCDVFVAFITEKSLSSHNCRREINFAVRMQKQIVSLFLDDVTLSLGMQMALSGIQGIFRSKFESTEDSVSKLLENEAVSQCRGDRKLEIPISRFGVTESADDRTVTLTVGVTKENYNQKKNFLYVLNSGERIDLERNVTTIGRSAEKADYVIEGDKTISRCHVAVKRMYGRFAVVDNESRNHTLINGHVLEPWTDNEIRSGDTICLGKAMLLFFKDYDENSAGSMPEHVLESDAETIAVGTDPVSNVRGMTIMNSGREYYLINTSADTMLFCNGERLLYGEKRRLKNEDMIMIGKEQFVWRIVL